MPSLGKLSSAPIISHKRKYIYVYIPKVACSTIREMLARIDRIKYYPNWTYTNGKIRTTKFKRVMINNISKYPNYYSFMFVRNPWDRLVSCYKDKVLSVRTLPNSPWVQDGVYKPFARHYNKDFRNMKFNQFVAFVSRVPDKRANGHFRSQHTFIQKQLPNLTFIGRFERFARDLAVVKKALGVTYKQKRIWSSKDRTPYKEYYTAKTKRMVAQRFAADIKLFNYKF